MPAVRCAAVAFMLSSFVLSILSSGGVGGISGAGRVTDAVNSSSTASLFFINSFCSL